MGEGGDRKKKEVFLSFFCFPLLSLAILSFFLPFSLLSFLFLLLAPRDLSDFAKLCVSKR